MLGDFESVKKRELCIRGSVVGFTVVYLQTNANPKTLIRAACVVSRKSKSGFPNQKTDHESIKSTLRVDSWNQIQIRSFEIDNLMVFLGKDLKKLFLTGGFSKKKGTQQMLYMCDFLTEPVLVAPYQFWAISYLSFHVCYLFKLLVDCF